ncbi:hypothetical protein EEB11_00240 [Pseudotabrizicola sediminis]|uniref:Rha family transcriptional regulator n=1 Tax=Pseudotabrizicola sediminis TaxID=2486418 RepID=A0ABY2KQM6_9RHOB|nr:Rha family transcriptional regulator [Pseudotabrizicola sediminis]TGD45053.1 hypothetical protein EEB11_00240 [Pseudotabrizicola sediminis]
MNNLPTTTTSKAPAPLPGTIPAICHGVPFMTSLAIAEMTGKRHDNVKRDVERELTSLGEDALKFEAVYLAGNGERRPCYALPGEYLLFIASAYDAKLRMQIIRHWSALNNGTAAPAPDAANVFVQRLISGGIEGRREQLRKDETIARAFREPNTRRAYLAFAGKP